MKKLIVFLFGFLLLCSPAWATPPLPQEAAGIGLEPKIGAQVPLNTPFVDQNGRPVSLASYLQPGRPVILTINYYECPMFCTLVLNALLESLSSPSLGFTPGVDFQVVTASLNPKEGPPLAKAKREVYAQELQKNMNSQHKTLPPETWAFLTGSEASIQELTKAVGFKYRYDEKQQQYNHAAGIYVLTPQGIVSQILYGVSYQTRVLRPALVEASEGKLGTLRDRFFLWCFHYDPEERSYVIAAKRMMQIGGLFTIMIVGGFLTYFWRQERRRLRMST